MSRLQAANNAQTALAALMDASATTCTVVTGDILPAVPFRATIDNEIIEVGAKTGNELSSILRGQEGTTAAAHQSGSLVEGKFTAGMHNELLEKPATNGTAGQVLTMNSTATAPEWKDSGLTTHIADNAVGWIPSTDTWTYASATSFTISGDKTAVYQKGDKFKLTANSVVKYGYIIAVSYSAPNTTVTVVGDALTNYTFSANYYSKAANPQGFPHYFAWTPTLTWTGATPTQQYGKYIFAVVGNTCFFEFFFQTSDGAGATNMTATPPIAPRNLGGYTMPCVGQARVSSTWTNPLAQINDTGNVISFNSFPTFTSGQACQIIVTGHYEI